jgi:hypothetical protein
MARGLTLLFAVAGGAAVSNMYWAQPLLDFITRGLHASTATAGWLIAATQVGYATGILIIVPLGDVSNRRRAARPGYDGLLRRGARCVRTGAVVRRSFRGDHRARGDHRRRADPHPRRLVTWPATPTAAARSGSLYRAFSLDHRVHVLKPRSSGCWKRCRDPIV